MAISPRGWNDLPPDLKQKFIDIADKGDWSPQEAYDHLVPDRLKDNFREVRAWMDGNPDIGVPDRDVSREVSGKNGGEYSTDNTAMEDSSVNRSRGSDNMTELEKQARDAQNEVDAEKIDDYYTEDEVAPVSSVLQDVEDVAEASAAATVIEATASFFEFGMEALAPAAGGVYAAKAVANRFEDPKDKWGYGAIAGGVTALFLASPPGQVVTIGYLGYRGYKRLRRIGQKKLSTT